MLKTFDVIFLTFSFNDLIFLLNILKKNSRSNILICTTLPIENFKILDILFPNYLITIKFINRLNINIEDALNFKNINRFLINYLRNIFFYSQKLL